MKEYVKIGNTGFTLIELMVALLVFAVGILAVGQMQVTSIRYNADAQRMSEASMLAQSKMEELMSIDYNDSELNDGTTSDTSNTHYTITTEITDIAPTTAKAETKQINVKVTWTSKGVNKEISIDCIRAELD